MRRFRSKYTSFLFSNCLLIFFLGLVFNLLFNFFYISWFFSLRSFSSSNSSWMGGSFLLVNPLVIKFFISFSGGKCLFPSLDFVLFDNSLSSDSFFSYKSLNFRCFLSFGSIGIFFAFESSSNYILLNESSSLESITFGDSI